MPAVGHGSWVATVEDDREGERRKDAGQETHPPTPQNETIYRTILSHPIALATRPKVRSWRPPFTTELPSMIIGCITQRPNHPLYIALAIDFDQTANQLPIQNPPSHINPPPRPLPTFNLQPQPPKQYQSSDLLFQTKWTPNERAGTKFIQSVSQHEDPSASKPDGKNTSQYR